LQIFHIDLSRDIGCAQRQTLALVASLSDRVEQRVVVTEGSSLHRALLEHAHPGVCVSPVANASIVSLLACQDADLLHVHDALSFSLGAVSCLFGTPLIADQCAVDYSRNRRVRRWCGNRAAFIVANSWAAAERVKSSGISASVEIIQFSAVNGRASLAPAAVAQQYYRLYVAAIYGVQWTWDFPRTPSSRAITPTRYPTRLTDGQLS